MRDHRNVSGVDILCVLQLPNNVSHTTAVIQNLIVYWLFHKNSRRDSSDHNIKSVL